MPANKNIAYNALLMDVSAGNAIVVSTSSGASDALNLSFEGPAFSRH